MPNMVKGTGVKRKAFSVLSISIWLVCLISLWGVHAYFNRRSDTKAFILTGHEIFQGLDNEEKTNVVRYDTAIIRLNGERYRLIGRGHESEERALQEEGEIDLKKVEFRIEDPILFERQAMVKEAYRALNNAEKKCFADHFATIIYRNGEYFFCFDKKKYSEYVLKYGTECTQCEELKNRK